MPSRRPTPSEARKSTPLRASKAQKYNFERAKELLRQAKEAEQLELYGRALGLYDDAIAMCEPGKTDSFIADLYRWKGRVHSERGETDAAHKCYSTSLEIAKRAKSFASEAHALNCLANISLRRGDQKETERLYDAAKKLARATDDRRLLGMIEQNHGVLANMRGDFEVATRYYVESLHAFESTHDEEPASWVLNNLGMLHTRTGNYSEAKSCLARAAAIAHRRRDRVVENVVALNLAELFVTMDRLDLADDVLARALTQAGRRGDHLTAAGALKLRATIERKRGALDKAIATLRIAIYEAQGAEDQLLHAEMLRELGDISRALGNVGAAKSAWREAAESFDHVGAKRDVDEVTSRITQLPT